MSNVPRVCLLMAMQMFNTYILEMEKKSLLIKRYNIIMFFRCYYMYFPTDMRGTKYEQ